MKKFFKDYWLYLCLVLVVIVGFLGYINGYRFGPYGLPVKAGLLVVADVPSQTTVYLDNIRRHYVEATSTSMYVTGTTHSVIVDAPGYQPWNELVTIPEGETLTLHPLLVRQQILEKKVEGADIAPVWQAIWKTVLPTKETPLLTSDGCVSIYTLGNRIVAEAVQNDTCVPPPYLCTADAGCAPVIVFEPIETIKDVLVYPNRTDALLVSSGNKVYVLEIDPRDPRFFAPLVRGTDVRVAPWKEHSIVVSDGASLREIEL